MTFAWKTGCTITEVFCENGQYCPGKDELILNTYEVPSAWLSAHAGLLGALPS